MGNVVIGGTATGATALPTYPTTVDRANDLLAIYSNANAGTYSISPDSMLGITGAPVGTTDTQTISAKTINSSTISNSNTITLKDGTSFKLQNASDTTKQAEFSLASITTGTTRTYTLPDVTDTLVTLGATQTLTSKTLTSPTINTPTISGGTQSSPAITTPEIITSLNDTNGNTLLGVTATASAVNYVNIADAASSNGPTISTAGSDSNINLNITPKGTGAVKIGEGHFQYNNVAFPDLLPWNIDIDPFTSEFNASSGTWTVGVISTTPKNGTLASDGTQNDYIEFAVPMAKGTWTIALGIRKFSSAGIYTLSLDGTSQGTIDGYSSSTSEVNFPHLTGLTVSSTGKHLFRITMATKNASSSNYIGQIYSIKLMRTA